VSVSHPLKMLGGFGFISKNFNDLFACKRFITIMFSNLGGDEILFSEGGY